MTSLKDKVASAFRMSPKSCRPSFRSYVTDAVDGEEESTTASDQQADDEEEVVVDSGATGESDGEAHIRLRHPMRGDGDETSDEVSPLLSHCFTLFLCLLSF